MQGKWQKAGTMGWLAFFFSFSLSETRAQVLSSIPCNSALSRRCDSQKEKGRPSRSAGKSERPLSEGIGETVARITSFCSTGLSQQEQIHTDFTLAPMPGPIPPLLLAVTCPTDPLILGLPKPLLKPDLSGSTGRDSAGVHGAPAARFGRVVHCIWIGNPLPLLHLGSPPPPPAPTCVGSGRLLQAAQWLALAGSWLIHGGRTHSLPFRPSKTRALEWTQGWAKSVERLAGKK